MLKHISIFFLSLLTVHCSSALAAENTNRMITEAALRETRDLISRELWRHYDLTLLKVVKIEDLRDRISLGKDYGLVKVTLEFSSERTTQRIQP